MHGKLDALSSCSISNATLSMQLHPLAAVGCLGAGHFGVYAVQPKSEETSVGFCAYQCTTTTIKHSSMIYDSGWSLSVSALQHPATQLLVMTLTVR